MAESDVSGSTQSNEVGGLALVLALIFYPVLEPPLALARRWF